MVEPIESGPKEIKLADDLKAITDTLKQMRLDGADLSALTGKLAALKALRTTVGAQKETELIVRGMGSAMARLGASVGRRSQQTHAVSQYSIV